MSYEAEYTRISQEKLNAILADSSGEILRTLSWSPDAAVTLSSRGLINQMHLLLTGDNSDRRLQSWKKSIFEQAKRNPAFPKQSLIELEEAATVAKGVENELRRVLKAQEDPQLVMRLNAAVLVLDFLDSRLLIGMLEQNYSDEVINKCYDGLVGLAIYARSVQTPLNDMLTKLRMNDAGQILTFCEHIHQMYRHMTDLKTTILMTQVVNARRDPNKVKDVAFLVKTFDWDMPDNLLSTAVYGGTALPDGGDGSERNYLTPDQVKAIAGILDSLSYEKLATENDTGIDEECFDEFKQFYMDAAKERQAVIRQQV